MSKSSLFVKYFKNINKLINSLLEKNLNKLNFNNFRNLLKNNKIIFTFVAVFLLSVSYLLLPNFYNKDDISKKLEKELINKFNLNFNFSDDLTYNFFPRPHFIAKNSVILESGDEISKIEKAKIYISLENLFSLKNVKVKDLILVDANFRLNKKNYNFFIKLLDKKFIDRTLKIKNSNIFFNNNDGEVLFINKIINMRYYYDSNELKNFIYAENEVFNMPYSIKIHDNKQEKKLVSKLNFNFLKFQVQNDHNYKNDIKFGSTNLIFNKLKSTFNYKLDKKYFDFNFYDKLENSNFSYNGKVNFNPFYAFINGKTQELNLNYLFNKTSFIIQLLKTEILNNKNLDFKLNINADNINKIFDLKEIHLISKIQDSLIDIDDTKFDWKNFANFKLSETLIFVKNGELILDGKLDISIKKSNEIYKYLLTPKKYRKVIKKINLNFSYNIDQKTIDLNNIRIDDKIINSVNEIMSNIAFKNTNLQNKIYLRKMINDAIKAYVG
mgnify:CR=1 FL=1